MVTDKKILFLQNIKVNPVTWKAKMKKEYPVEDMNYLDPMVARPSYPNKQADIVVDNKCKGIVDIGCLNGHGKSFYSKRGYTGYNYMGFDTSPLPIAKANEDWKDHGNVEYRVGTWDDEQVLKVDFDVDTLIMSGVLIYCPTIHEEFYAEFHIIQIYLID